MGVGLVALGPGRFYGSGLPRPRYFSDVKLNDERVDPPASVLDPLLTWANEAHWSMGGLSFQRYRLQGRIEGSIKKLRAQHDRSDRKKRAAAKIRISGVKPTSPKSPDSLPAESSEEIGEETAAVMPPPKKKRARKLIDEFEMVAAKEKSQTPNKPLVNPVVPKDSPKKAKKDDAVDVVSSRTRSRKLSTGKKEVVSPTVAGPLPRRTSPRNALPK
ncbi:hypothetical protein KSP40_PGU009421 [Platanthera guangdongensis]|uniref:Uncharacterized protein n=1 Tax=Platanthera guangdongensis TaxID=2320717 RepID=A0ABR2MQJ2_9ASPA